MNVYTYVELVQQVEIKYHEACIKAARDLYIALYTEPRGHKVEIGNAQRAYDEAMRLAEYSLQCGYSNLAWPT